MNARARQFCAAAEAVMSEVKSGGATDVLEPCADLRAVVCAMGASWLQVTAAQYAEQCANESWADARLRDLHWGLLVGYHIARRQEGAELLETLANEGGSSE